MSVHHFLIKSCLGLALASCAVPSEDRTRIEISEPNQLGVVTVEVARFEQDQANVFELRGLDAREHEVAQIRVRTGFIADLDRAVPGRGDIGSEILVSSVGARDLRGVTRETHVFRLPESDLTPALHELVKLGAVATALGDAGFVLDRPNVEQPLEVNPYTYNCAAGDLNTSPDAVECCFDHWGKQRFYNANTLELIDKWKGSYGPCKAVDGGSCSGRNCYFGPNGFSTPTNWGTGYYSNARIHSLASYDCDYYDYNYDPPECASWTLTGYDCQLQIGSVEFPTATGTFATGQGCPGGDDGAGMWDY